MKRFVRAAAAAAVVAGGLGAAGCAGSGAARGVAPDGCGPAGGCPSGQCGDARGGGKLGNGNLLRTYYDPCWPERYNAAARDEVLDPFRKQVNNGLVLHHTLWNYYFETGTDVLTPAGQAKLVSIAQERPAPDPRIFIQTARDITVVVPTPAVPGDAAKPGDPGNLEKIPELRDDLDARRTAAVQRFLAAQPGFQAVAYEFHRHDPMVLGLSSEFAASAYRGQAQGYGGGLRGGSGGTATSTGGGAASGAAVGGGAGGGGGTAPR